MLGLGWDVDYGGKVERIGILVVGNLHRSIRWKRW